MRQRGRVAALLFSGAALLGGCGGCQNEAAPPPPAARPAAEKAAPPTAPPAAQLPAEPAAEEPDCFVIVDAEPDYGDAPLTVHFETDVDCTSSPVTYEWDFGDGEKGGNEANPTHVYSKYGEYVATVRVSIDGASNEDEIDISVDQFFAD